MNLTTAKNYADNAVARATALNSTLVEARQRLEQTRSNGGVRNSERAQQRLERRLFALRNELELRGVTV